MPRSAFAAQSLDVRWPKAPVAACSTRYDVQVEVGHFLSAACAVVLVQQNTVCTKPVRHCLSKALCSEHDGRTFVDLQIEDRRRMSPRNDDALPDLELPSVEQRHRQRRFLNDLPLIDVARNDFTEVTGLLLG